MRRRKAEIVKVLTDVNWADRRTKPLTKVRLEEFLAMMPISRRECLDWAAKASTVLAFLATLQTAAAKFAEHGLMTRDGSIKVYEPNTEKS